MVSKYPASYNECNLQMLFHKTLILGIFETLQLHFYTLIDLSNISTI